MRIGIVLSDSPPYSETFFRNKIRKLKEHGYEVTLFVDAQSNEFDICPIYAGFSKQGGIKSLFRALGRLILNWPSALRLFSANKRDGFSLKENTLSLLKSAHILHTKLDWLQFGFATIALGRENLASVMKAKLSVSIRGFDMYVYPLNNPGCYTLLWKRIDKLHTISNYLLSLATQLGFDATQKPHRLITAAIDTAFFKPAEHRVSHAIPKIVTVARLHWLKGIDYIIDALARLKAMGVDFEYHVIGAGDSLQSLVFSTHQQGLSDRVYFHGKQKQTFINDILDNAEIFIMYSNDEGFCNSALEAQCKGCLCIVSDNPALAENVVDGETGWVVPKRNPQQLANVIQHVLALPEDEKNTIRQRASNRIRQEFSLSVQVNKFVQYYEEV